MVNVVKTFIGNKFLSFFIEDMPTLCAFHMKKKLSKIMNRTHMFAYIATVSLTIS